MKEKAKKIFSGKVDLRTYSMIIALIVIAIAFQMITNGIFLSARNISNLVRSMSITGVIAPAVVLLMISGGIDLSVGSIVALTGGIAAILQVNHGWGTIPVILVALAIGIVLGAWQGYWVAYQNIPAFIATMAGMLAYRGIYLAMTNGITITPLQPDFNAISTGFVTGIAGYILIAIATVAMIFSEIKRRQTAKTLNLGNSGNIANVVRLVIVVVLMVITVYILNTYNGIPYPVVVLMVLLVIFHFVASRTKFGRDVYAIGGNMEAARLSGINVKKNMLLLYTLTGALSAISGILLTSRLNGATSAAGTSYEMDVISACVIGGTSMSGGKGSVFGMLVGLLIIASLDNGMSLMNLSSSYQSIVKGMVLLFAVWFDVASQKKK